MCIWRVPRIPENGTTAGFPNSQLRYLAFLGIATVYLEMKEPLEEEIAKNIITAIYVDPATAKLWFGEQIVSRLLTICPQCGFENRLTAKICARDGYPLNAGQKPPSQLPSPTSTLHLVREPALSVGIYAFQITLDDKQIGSIRQRESCTFQVEPGHHTIFLRVVLYLSPHLAFDIAPGEKVTFFCQASYRGIQLWKQ